MYPIQTAKLAVVQMAGLSKDALHVYVGMAIFCGVAMISRRGAASLGPWLAVLTVVGIGEVVDMWQELSTTGFWQWTASLHDAINTLCWPTVLLLGARFTRMFSSGNRRI